MRGDLGIVVTEGESLPPNYFFIVLSQTHRELSFQRFNEPAGVQRLGVHVSARKNHIIADGVPLPTRHGHGNPFSVRH